MKSSFLFTILVTALTATVASAQVSTRPSPKEIEQAKKSTFDKFSERLKISYFGVLTTPHFDDMFEGEWENAAISPQYGQAEKGEGKNRDTWPLNLWNQISFNYNFGAKLNFVVNPRFMIPLQHPVDMKAPEDRSLIMLDDIMAGFQGVIASSDDKALNLWVRAGLRFPTSRANRNSGQGGAGTLTHQVDLAYNLTYDFNKTFQLGIFNQFRQWVIDDRYNFTRARIVTNPYMQFTLNDVSKILVYYENMLETNRRSKPSGDRDPVFKDVWQAVMVGYSHDVTSKLNLMPYVSVFVDDNPITDKSAFLGAWISYSIK